MKRAFLQQKGKAVSLGLNLDFTHRGRAPTLPGCQKNKQTVQCPMWSQPAPEPSQRESEMLLAGDCGLCCPQGWALSRARSQLGGCVALGTLLGCQGSSLTLPGGSCSTPTTPKTRAQSSRGARRPGFCPQTYLKSISEIQLQEGNACKTTKLIYSGKDRKSVV